MDSDRKLLPESREILEAAVRRVHEQGVQFLLVPGDLTKDGEKQDHLLMAEELSGTGAHGRPRVRCAGQPRHSQSARGPLQRRARTRVPNVTPAEFAEIYRDAGYGEALFRDPVR